VSVCALRGMCCVYMCVYDMYVCTYMCMHVYVCVFVCVSVRSCVCVCVCVYAHHVYACVCDVNITMYAQIQLAFSPVLLHSPPPR
jgi:hypothetical protein